MVVDQVLNGALHVVAESAAVGIAVAKVAAQKPKRELLIQLVGGVGVLQGFEKIPVHGPRVATHQLRRRDVGLVGGSGMGLKDHGPLSGHLTQMRIEFDIFHEQPPPPPKGPPRHVDRARVSDLSSILESIIPLSIPHFSKKPRLTKKSPISQDSMRPDTYE